MSFKDRFGLDGYDLALHAAITLGLILPFFALGEAEAFVMAAGFVTTGSLVVLAIRRALALRRMQRERLPEREAERLALLESRVEDLEATQARIVELEERLDFAERMLARETAPRLLDQGGKGVQ